MKRFFGILAIVVIFFCFEALSRADDLDLEYDGQMNPETAWDMQISYTDL